MIVISTGASMFQVNVSEQKEIIWQQYRLCLAVAEYQILGCKHFLILGPESGMIWWLKKGTILPKKKVSLQLNSASWQKTQVDFLAFWRSFTTT